MRALIQNTALAQAGLLNTALVQAGFRDQCARPGWFSWTMHSAKPVSAPGNISSLCGFLSECGQRLHIAAVDREQTRGRTPAIQTEPPAATQVRGSRSR